MSDQPPSPAPPGLLLVFRSFPGKEWSILDDLDEADEDTETLAEGYRLRGFRVVRYVLPSAERARLRAVVEGMRLDDPVTPDLSTPQSIANLAYNRALDAVIAAMGDP